ncbi:MAG: hypothetical protein INH41_02125 [Myxococcaceae bacterium]|nr:hypothetical protein [Myxococcaceae bacterium]
MRRPPPLALVTLACAAALSCPRPDASVQPDRGAAPLDAGSPVDPELVQLRAALLGLERDVGAAMRSTDEALWAHWTTGARLDLSAATAARAALVTPERFALLQRATARDADDPRALMHLEAHLSSERVALALAADGEALTARESALTFSVEGKEVRWRELNRLLAAERSALKRKALWTASLTAAATLERALEARDAKLAALLAPQRPFDALAAQRDVEPEAMRRVAEGVLTLTGEAWRLTLERLNAADTRLPLGALTRADLPRLLRVPADVELAFDPKAFAPRATSLLEGLGLGRVEGLTLDLAESPKKHPLPLTVAPGGPADVRLSVRPLGGLRDQQLLFSELGVALALRHAATGRLAFDRLGDPAVTQVTGELLALLPLEPAWLDAVGVRPEARQTVIDAAAAQRLFLVRRAAVTYLARLDAVEAGDAQASARAAALFTRALGVQHTEADMARLRSDTDDALRSATTLRAMLLAEALRQALANAYGPTWFREKATGTALVELWRAGTSSAAEERLVPLGDALTAFWERTVSLTPVGLPADGGVVVRPWPALREGPERPMSTARPWPRPIGPPITDGGTQVRDWPSMTPRAVDLRWVPRPWPQLQERQVQRDDAGVGPAP